jgi:hypothetical protein
MGSAHSVASGPTAAALDRSGFTDAPFSPIPWLDHERARLSDIIHERVRALPGREAGIDLDHDDRLSPAVPVNVLKLRTMRASTKQGGKNDG